MRRLSYALWPLLLLAACSGAPERQQSSAPTGLQKERTLVFECDDLEFIARTGPGQIALYLPDDDYRVLTQERAASGVRYSDGDVSLHMKGQEASLELGHRRLTACRENPSRVPWEEARRRGVNFRAIGQEPAWYLEIQHDRSTLFVAAYGNRRVLVETPEVTLEGELEVYESSANGHELRIEIELEHCTDSMSGEVFDSRVSINLDGEAFSGCGSELKPWWE